MKLKIAKGFSLPAEYVTETGAVLAVRGAGKSTTAAVLAEEMFKAKLPFVAVDPVGSWYGLRASKDGSADGGLPIPIFGGDHGDVPLERGGGELIADLVIDKRLSCVLDLSGFDSEAAKKEFLLHFARRLYTKNRDPLHLFLEESDDYIPQRPMRDETYLLRAWENIVRRGRARGLGMTMITQRSAAINKTVLTQVGTLFAMRTTSPQDRKAIEEWVKYHGERQDILESLSSMKAGEAWVWSPYFLGTVKRIQVRRRETFDSGATPKNLKASSERPHATLADIDLGAIHKRMSETIERAKAEDPRELQKEIRRLKAELAKQPEIDMGEFEERLAREYDRGRAEGTQAMANRATLARRSVERLGEMLSNAQSLLGEARSALEMESAAAPVPQPLTRRPVSQPLPAPIRAPRKELAESNGNLTGPEQRILNAVAWMESIGVNDPDQAAVAFLAGYRVGGGAFNNPRGALRTKGLIDYPSGGRICLTPEGRQHAVPPEVPLTTAELHRAVLDRLPGPEQKILQPLLDAYPGSLSNEDLAEASGYTQGGGAFNNPRGRLRTLGLIDYPSPGQVVAREILFLKP